MEWTSKRDLDKLAGMASRWLSGEFNNLPKKDKLRVSLSIVNKALPQVQEIKTEGEIKLSVEQMRIIESKVRDELSNARKEWLALGQLGESGKVES